MGFAYPLLQSAINLGFFRIELFLAWRAVIATAKVIRTFLIVETLDLLSLEPSAFCPVPSAFCYSIAPTNWSGVLMHLHKLFTLFSQILKDFIFILVKN